MRLRTSRREAASDPVPDPRRLASARIDALVAPLRERAEPPYGVPVPGPVTTTLYARLAPEDVAATEAALEGSTRELWDRTPAVHHPVLVLPLGAFYEIPGVLQKTGLVRAQPPDDVHAMARGELAYGGDVMLADLVAHAFELAGLPLPGAGTVLDFGCSSGRVLRVIGAYAPELNALGCDPNADAIAWAAEHLPMARFFTSPTTPPLELEDASVDRAYAISIWSHFSGPAALSWLDEMHRVLKPGGALLMTTHGVDTIAAQLRQDLMTDDSAADAVAEMLRSGHKFFDVFGEEGDWGVKDPGWGNAYTSTAWFAERVTPAWSVRLFRPAMLAQNQDVFVLEKAA